MSDMELDDVASEHSYSGHGGRATIELRTIKTQCLEGRRVFSFNLRTVGQGQLDAL